MGGALARALQRLWSHWGCKLSGAPHQASPKAALLRELLPELAPGWLLQNAFGQVQATSGCFLAIHNALSPLSFSCVPFISSQSCWAAPISASTAAQPQLLPHTPHLHANKSLPWVRYTAFTTCMKEKKKQNKRNLIKLNPKGHALPHVAIISKDLIFLPNNSYGKIQHEELLPAPRSSYTKSKWSVKILFCP